jgi:hypothetical protein
MVEKEPYVEFIPGETIKREAAARHLIKYANPNPWNARLALERWAIALLAKDTVIPLIENTLETIEDRSVVG